MTSHITSLHKCYWLSVDLCWLIMWKVCFVDWLGNNHSFFNHCHSYIPVYLEMFVLLVHTTYTWDRKQLAVYDVYIMYWMCDEQLKPCCCNGCSRSQKKKSVCTALLRILGRQFTHVSTSPCAVWSCSVVNKWITTCMDDKPHRA